MATYIRQSSAQLSVVGGVQFNGAITSGVAGGSNAITLTTNQKIQLAPNATIYSDNASIQANLEVDCSSQILATSFRSYIAANPAVIYGTVLDGASAAYLVVDGSNALTTAGAAIQKWSNQAVTKAVMDKDGKLVFLATDNSGSPGNTTINKASGRAAIASGASTVTVTNSLVSATSIVHVQLETSAAGIGGLVVVPGSGSFTVTSVSGTGVVTVTTAITKFSFVVFN
jgi:hypothetical protein